MTITISYEQQRFIVMDLSLPSLLVYIYGDIWDRHEKLHFQKYRCCGAIQGLSRIMTIITDNDRHHFISTTKIYGYGPFSVVTIDALYGGVRWSSPFRIFGEDRKMSPKFIGDGQKSLLHQKLIVAISYGCQGKMESNHQPPACKVGALPLS